jgi:multidrug transporter EmrE-like cation transporter
MEQVSKYFNAKKNESIIFILAGIIAIIVSFGFFIKTKQPFYNGVAYSLIAIALIQLTVGVSVYFKYTNYN